VSKRLGHANVYTTASIYSHSLPREDAKAAELWDAQVRPVLGQQKLRQ